MHEKARFHHWQGTGSLSIKSFRSGRALYNAGRGCYAVDQNSYLVLNHGQRYSITVDSDKSVESFCIFFQAGLSGDVFRSLTSNPVTLLDNPYPPRPKELTFFERTYPHDDVLSPALFHLRDALGNLKEEPFRRDELLHGVMERLLVAHCRVYKEIAALESARAATREELYRRAHRARDFILACFDRTLTLGEIAAVACLSPNHLLRVFKQVFRQTPHQFLTYVRLENAKRLLSETTRPVTDISFSVGFESLGSFSWLFRRKVGMSPQAYRSKKGDFREAPRSVPPYKETRVEN